jgi:glycosyltransferase involved in cell wall biosynthesis
VTTAAARTLLVSTIAGEHETPQRVGSASYSYYYVYRAFAPLLQRWGSVVESVRPAERLDDLARNAAVHLGFLPLDFFHRSSRAPNVAYPFWDFPHLPAAPLGGNPQNDWTAAANALDLILTCSEFTRDAFARSGVHTRMCVVPVPVRAAYLDIPLWHSGQRVVVGCRAYVLQPSARSAAGTSGAARLYHRRVRSVIPRRWADTVSAAAHAWRDHARVDCPTTEPLELSGTVYTTVLNPFDPRKNWPDLLTAFLFALGDCDDATLLIKLALPPDRAAAGVNKILAFYRRLALDHRCRVVLVSDYLDDEQMLQIARGSTYYLNASRAEGACLPLQDFLAAARPAIAPRHTAIADYFSADCGFVAESHEEPASWPQDPDGRCTTSWHRLVWPSLRDAIRESYKSPQYNTLAANARATMAARAGADAVWPRLAAALDSVTHAV